MIIAIDLTSLSYHLSGIERYAMCVTDELIDLDQNNSYILIFRNEIIPLFLERVDGKRIRAIVLHGDNKLFFLQVILARVLKKIKADKYLFFAFPSPLLFNRPGIINAIHDMGAWDSSEEMARLSKFYFRALYRNAAKVSEKIITVSNFSRERISEMLNIPKGKIEVIYSAVSKEILNKEVVPFETVKAEYDLPNKYIMTLSTLEPRKNIKILLEAFDRIAEKVDYSLVLVGRKGWKMDEIIAKYSQDYRIRITDFVDDEHISAIYKNAMCFIFPSLYEGFGLPPVEALSFGTPVISSNAASMPEVLREQAVFFESDNVDELEELLLMLECNLTNMPHNLDEYQKENYRFDSSAHKVLDLLQRPF